MIHFDRQKKKPSGHSPKKRSLQKTLQAYKFRFLLFYTLPITIITIGSAVLDEYGKIRARRAAMEAEALTPSDTGDSSVRPSGQEPRA